MSNLTSEQKIDYISFAVVDLLGRAKNGALLFDVAFDENFEGKMSYVEGKAFTTDGINFFGYIEDKKVPANFSSLNNRLFSGTYVDGKGMSVLMLPNNETLLKNSNRNLTLTATNRENDDYMHGRSIFGTTRVKADLVENATGEDVSKVMRTFFDRLAYMTSMYPDKTYDLIQNGYNVNIPYIEMAYDKFKNRPIPKCFADDGAPSNGPVK